MVYGVHSFGTFGTPYTPLVFAFFLSFSLGLAGTDTLGEGPEKVTPTLGESFLFVFLGVFVGLFPLCGY